MSARTVGGPLPVSIPGQPTGLAWERPLFRPEPVVQVWRGPVVAEEPPNACWSQSQARLGLVPALLGSQGSFFPSSGHQFPHL